MEIIQVLIGIWKQKVSEKFKFSVFNLEENNTN